MFDGRCTMFDVRRSMFECRVLVQRFSSRRRSTACQVAFFLLLFFASSQPLPMRSGQRMPRHLHPHHPVAVTNFGRGPGATTRRRCSTRGRRRPGCLNRFVRPSNTIVVAKYLKLQLVCALLCFSSSIFFFKEGNLLRTYEEEALPLHWMDVEKLGKSDTLHETVRE